MEELKLTGNHLNGSRPLLTFSSNFDKDPHWKLLKELIMQVSGLLLKQLFCTIALFQNIGRTVFFLFLPVKIIRGVFLKFVRIV